MGIGRCRGAFQVEEQGRRGHRARRGGRAGEPVQQLRAEQASVPRPALRVEDLEVRPTAGWAIPVACHLHDAPLADDIPAQPDPARPAQLQAQPARLLNGRGEGAAQLHGLHHDEHRPGPPGERREPAQPVTHPLPGHRRVPPVRQVQDQQVHGPGRQQRGGERQRLLEVRRRQHDEPLRPDPARDGLHGIEGAGEVQPGHDRPAGLRLRGEPECDGGLARGRGPAQRDGRRARQPARAQDGVQGREPCWDDPSVHIRRGGPRTARDDRRQRRGGERTRCILGAQLDRVRRHDDPRERPLHRQAQVPASPRSGRAPA
jgi:hypothetical protein